MKINYSSSNSGGNWWLRDEDWINLEKAGWKVDWVKDWKVDYLPGRERHFGALAIKRSIVAAQSPEVTYNIELDRLKRDILNSMATAKGIDEDGLAYPRAAFVNSAVNLIQRRFDNGYIELAQELLRYVDEVQADWKKPFITNRHKIYKIMEAQPVSVPDAQTGQI